MGSEGAERLAWPLCSQRPHHQNVLSPCAQWRLRQPLR